MKSDQVSLYILGRIEIQCFNAVGVVQSVVFTLKYLSLVKSEILLESTKS